MKQQQQSICKFVTQKNAEAIVTKNFVYESHAEVAGKMHILQNHTVGLVVCGHGKLILEMFEHQLRPGTLFFTFSGIPFRLENSDGLEYMYVTFSGTRADELFERFHILPSCCVFKGHEGLLSFWQNCLGKANESNLDLISESVLFYTLSELSPTVSNGEQKLAEQVCKYVDEHFNENSLSLHVVAETMGYSEKYISWIFKQNVGITFSQYLKNARIQYAIFLMEQGISSVKNVAFLAGYRDPFYFSHVFRETVGISPSEFMEQHIDQESDTAEE